MYTNIGKTVHVISGPFTGVSGMLIKVELEREKTLIDSGMGKGQFSIYKETMCEIEVDNRNTIIVHVDFVSEKELD